LNSQQYVIEEKRMTDSQKGTIFLLAGAIMISFSPVFVKLADVGPTVAGFYRMLFGGLLLLGIVIVRRQQLFRGSRFLMLACLCGFVFAADLAFWHRSIHFVGPGLATLLGNFQVFFLAAFGFIILREKVAWKLAVSIPAAIIGLAMIVGVDFSTMQAEYKLGVLFGILTALMYASYLIIFRRIGTAARLDSSMPVVALISISSAIFLGMMALPLGESFVIPDNASILVLISYGMVCQVGGWVVISMGIPLVEASRIGLILLLQPALAFVWDIMLFGRPITAIEIAGAIIALAAIYLGGLSRSGKKPPVTQ